MFDAPDVTEEQMRKWFGNPRPTIAEILSHDMFKGGTMDLHLHGVHYRFKDIWPVKTDRGVILEDQDNKTEYYRIDNGRWVRIEAFEFDLSVYWQSELFSHCDDEEDFRFLMLINGRSAPDGSEARVVLYPWRKQPRPGDMQVAGWEDPTTPIIANVLTRRQA